MQWAQSGHSLKADWIYQLDRKHCVTSFKGHGWGLCLLVRPGKKKAPTYADAYFLWSFV